MGAYRLYAYAYVWNPVYHGRLCDRQSHTDMGRDAHTDLFFLPELAAATVGAWSEVLGRHTARGHLRWQPGGSREAWGEGTPQPSQLGIPGTAPRAQLTCAISRIQSYPTKPSSAPPSPPGCELGEGTPLRNWP